MESQNIVTVSKSSCMQYAVSFFRRQHDLHNCDVNLKVGQENLCLIIHKTDDITYLYLPISSARN